MTQGENGNTTSPSLTPQQEKLSRAFLVYGAKKINVDKILANSERSSPESI